MKVKLMKLNQEIREIEVCDKCGSESEEDNVLINYSIIGLNLYLHKRCKILVEDRIRISLGLKTLSDIKKMSDNGRYNSSVSP